jgi:hypothetical protein
VSGTGKREIKRFDPVLKNVLSSTVKIILSLAGIKVQKISYLPEVFEKCCDEIEKNIKKTR